MLDTETSRPDQYRFDNEWRPMDVRHEDNQREGQAFSGLGRARHASGSSGDRVQLRAARRRRGCAEADPDRRHQSRNGSGHRRDDAQRETPASWTRLPSAGVFLAPTWCSAIVTETSGIESSPPCRCDRETNRGMERMAMPGRGRSDDWQEIVPGELLPGVMNPAAGFLYSANHRPVGAWYPIPLGIATGNGGDTTRSWRLRERLQAVERFSPEAVLDIHRDSVNPARREIVRVGLHLRDGLRRDLPQNVRQALSLLEPWYRSGASSALTSPGAELAIELNIFFRMITTDLALVYGGGEAGLVYFPQDHGGTARSRSEGRRVRPRGALHRGFADCRLANGAAEVTVRIPQRGIDGRARR